MATIDGTKLYHSSIETIKNLRAENEKLHRMLAEVVDNVVGSSYHDLRGYGYGDDEITAVKEVCTAYWAKRGIQQ